MTRHLVMLMLPEGADPDDLHFICTGPGYVENLQHVHHPIILHHGVIQNAAVGMARALYNHAVEKSQ